MQIQHSARFRTGAVPFLRWAGSKRKIIPILLDLAPAKFARYVEPFAGSACLFFALRPAQAILSDINVELINTYQTLKANVEGVIKHLSLLNCGEEEYYRIRSQANSKMTNEKRAARFIYLNRFCFNGLYRTNKQGKFNVPYGAHKAGNLPSATVVLVDDFSGTGTQACGSWHIFEELLTGRPRIVLMLVAATEDALERIAGETEMEPVCSTVLRRKDGLFHADCAHFTQGEKNTILNYCTKADPHEPKGFGKTGLLVVLAHRTPNNAVPILHASNDEWQGLFPRHD